MKFHWGMKALIELPLPRFIENVLRSTLSYPNETSKECIQFLNKWKQKPMTALGQEHKSVAGLNPLICWYLRSHANKTEVSKQWNICTHFHINICNIWWILVETWYFSNCCFTSTYYRRTYCAGNKRYVQDCCCLSCYTSLSYLTYTQVNDFINK